MDTDQFLIVTAITAYIVGALALFTYFLSRERLPKLIGIPFACLGCAVQFFELGYRFATSHIWPLTNLYGSLSLFAAMSVAIFIAFAAKYDFWFIGGFVQALSASFLAYALTWNEGYLPAVPALQSYWIKIHVPLVVSSYAAFLVAMVTSVPVVRAARLGRRRGTDRRDHARRRLRSATRAAHRRRRLSGPRAGRRRRQHLRALARDAAVPREARHHDVSGRVRRPAAPHGRHHHRRLVGQRSVGRLLAVGSQRDRGARLHLHTRNSWRGLRSAWMSVLGFITIMFCYLGVNIWISGLHSYKM